MLNKENMESQTDRTKTLRSNAILVGLVFCQIYFGILIYVTPSFFLWKTITVLVSLDLVLFIYLIYFFERKTESSKKNVLEKFERPLYMLLLCIFIGFNPYTFRVLLWSASGAGRDLAVETLISIGTNPNFIENGNTPLMMATIWNHPSTVEILLNHGAEISFKNEKNQTAKSIALERGFMAIENILAKKEK
jgi:hypothetical protein